MAHYAKLDENNVVTDILVVDNEWEREKGEPFILQWLKDGWGGTKWVKTSYNTHLNNHQLGGEPLRYNYAQIDGTYDPVRDAFIPTKAAGFDSWILDENTCVWKAPIDVPDDASTTVFYEWNESAYQADNTKGWVKDD